jgi:hypothetical protein
MRVAGRASRLLWWRGGRRVPLRRHLRRRRVLLRRGWGLRHHETPGVRSSGTCQAGNAAHFKLHGNKRRELRVELQDVCGNRRRPRRFRQGVALDGVTGRAQLRLLRRGESARARSRRAAADVSAFATESCRSFVRRAARESNAPAGSASRTATREESLFRVMTKLDVSSGADGLSGLLNCTRTVTESLTVILLTIGAIESCAKI